MDQDLLWRQYAALPAGAQREVLDFIAFLSTRAARPMATKPVRKGDLADEPLVGVWRDREDMADSVTWLRTIRQREWERSGG